MPEQVRSAERPNEEQSDEWLDRLVRRCTLLTAFNIHVHFGWPLRTKELLGMLWNERCLAKICLNNLLLRKTSKCIDGSLVRDSATRFVRSNYSFVRYISYTDFIPLCFGRLYLYPAKARTGNRRRWWWDIPHRIDLHEISAWVVTARKDCRCYSAHQACNSPSLHTPNAKVMGPEQAQACGGPSRPEGAAT